MYHASTHLTTCDVIACNDFYQAIPPLNGKMKLVDVFDRTCTIPVSHALSPVDWAHLSPRSMQLCEDPLQHVGQDSFLYA